MALRRDIVTTIATRLVKIAAGLGTAIITARSLGDAGRGEYFLIVTIALTLVQLGNLGLHSSNTYEVARNPSLLSPLLSNSFWISIGIGVGLAAATAGGAAAFGWFSTTSADLLAVVLTVLVPTLLFILLGSNLLVGMSRISAFNAFELGSTILLVAALGVAALAGFGVRGFVLLTTACWTLVALLLLANLRRGIRGLRFRPDTFKTGLRYSFRAYGIALLAFLVLRGNVFLLDHYAGVEELGRYSVALQVVDVLIVLPSSVALVVFPDLVRNAEQRWGRVTRSLLPMAVLSGLTSAAAGLVAKPVFEAMFGAEFSESAAMLWWMLPGVFCLSLATLLSQYLAAIGIPLEVIIVWMLACGIVIGAGFILIPDHGGVGAGAAFSIGYAFVLVALYFVGVRRSRITDSVDLVAEYEHKR